MDLLKKEVQVGLGVYVLPVPVHTYIWIST